MKETTGFISCLETTFAVGTSVGYNDSEAEAKSLVVAVEDIRIFHKPDSGVSIISNGVYSYKFYSSNGSTSIGVRATVDSLCNTLYVIA